MKIDPSKCTAPDCPNPPRMALRTTRPTREKLTTTIHYDNRTAPATASPYCRWHGAECLAQLVTTLTESD